MTKADHRTLGFCGQYVTINTYDQEAADLLDFLGCDLQTTPDASPRAIYDLMVAGNTPKLSLRQGEKQKQLYRGDCRYELAYTLINEIIYQCIVDNRAGFALHAAAVGSEQGGVLLPGKSGSGKSTLTNWLVARGCNYLTDELVLLAGSDHRIHPFTRPLSLKAGSRAVLSSLMDDEDQMITGADGFMLPHRLLTSRHCPATPPLSLILFPEYKAGAATELTTLSAAQGCARLMECYVNARNIQDHGIDRLAELSRGTPIYQLIYGNFDGLEQLLLDLFPTLFGR